MKTIVASVALALSLLFLRAEGPPVARVTLVNATRFPSDVFGYDTRSGTIISTNGGGAIVTVDGSASIDPDGNPLEYEAVYFDEDSALNLAGPGTNAVLSFDGYTGDGDRQRFALRVYGAGGRSDVYFAFSVLTPAEAAYYMIGDLDEVEEILDGVRFRFRQALITALTHASNRLAHGHLQRGIRSLRNFQRLIRPQHRRLGAPLTAAFIKYTDTVIETVRPLPAATH